MASPLLFLIPKNKNPSERKTSGLYHRKFLIIDDKELYLGSANTTISSPFYARRITSLAFTTKNSLKPLKITTPMKVTIYPYTSSLRIKKWPFKKLLHTIDHAKDSIQIAMYTLTHKKIIQALIKAKKTWRSYRHLYGPRNGKRGV